MKKVKKDVVKAVSSRQVVMVSAYGRGAYLALELKRIGFKVTVFDVTSLLPTLSSAEREGPFGVFLPSHLSDLEKQYLCEDNHYPVPKGFSLFTPKGPVEFQGPLRNFFKKSRKDFECFYSAFTPSVKGDFSKKISIKNPKTLKREIKSNSILSLSAEWAKNYFSPRKADQNPLNLSPFLENYVLRESSQRYFEEVKSSLKAKGVKWIEEFITSEALELTENDIGQKDNKARSRKNINKKLIENGQNLIPFHLKLKKRYIQLKFYEEEKKADFLIWTLSGPETLKGFSKYMPLIFPKWEKPLKIWRRFSLSWNQGAFEHIIPPWLWVLPDYKSENVHTLSHKFLTQDLLKQSMILRKNPVHSRLVDLWLTCPYEKRFNNSFLSELLKPALKRLNILFPGFSIKGLLKPDFCHEYFVLYKNRFTPPPSSRLLHLNPEGTGKMDAYSLIRQSSFILKRIQNKYI